MRITQELGNRAKDVIRRVTRRDYNNCNGGIVSFTSTKQHKELMQVLGNYTKHVALARRGQENSRRYVNRLIAENVDPVTDYLSRQ